MKDFKFIVLGWWLLITLIFALPFLLSQLEDTIDLLFYLYFGGGLGYFLLLLLPTLLLLFIKKSKIANLISKIDVYTFIVLSLVGHGMICLSAWYYINTCVWKLCDITGYLYLYSPLIWFDLILGIDLILDTAEISWLNNLIIVVIMILIPLFIHKQFIQKNTPTPGVNSEPNDNFRSQTNI